uniref:hypothetical protein n=1 Tax=Pedobacter schmidteae TaxID=2201271 RepID=UPI000EAFBAA8|nr:hypothetical protein [Pedobacter schmidteae]
MKKLLGLIAIMALGLTTTFAQTPAAATSAPAKKMVKKEVKTVAAPAKKEAKAATETVKTTAVKTTTATAAKASPLKKDGTPDMRLKENKAKMVTKPVAHAKKDGTPDMRYKENKGAAKKGK